MTLVGPDQILVSNYRFLMMKAQTRTLPVENLEGSKGLGDVANAHRDPDQSDGVSETLGNSIYY